MPTLSAAKSQAAATDPFDVAMKRENDYLRRLDVTVDPAKVAATRRKEAARLRKNDTHQGFPEG